MQEMSYFYMLKGELLSKYQEVYPSWKGAIHDFKTKEIANFQILLENRVGSRVSEKWFYTHIKPLENKKLPRIDTLNILSQFIGYENWEVFVYKRSKEEKRKEKNSPAASNIASKRSFVFIAGMLFLSILVAGFFLQSTAKYSLCFVDADNGKPIEGSIEVSILKSGESPFVKEVDEKGCVTFEESNELIRFVVSAPYYKSDTIIRSLRQEQKKEVIKLRKDDFAMMIHLFSTNDLKEWKKRRKQLNKMFDDDVVIFQINKDNLGLEMYNKTEFINKLTMPINSLKNIRIVDAQYRKGKIFEMRFVQEEKIRKDEN